MFVYDVCEYIGQSAAAVFEAVPTNIGALRSRVTPLLRIEIRLLYRALSCQQPHRTARNMCLYQPTPPEELGRWAHVGFSTVD